MIEFTLFNLINKKKQKKTTANVTNCIILKTKIIKKFPILDLIIHLIDSVQVNFIKKIK